MPILDFKRSLRILVTGGAGFIGSTLVRMLLDQGHEVIVYDAFTYAAAGGAGIASLIGKPRFRLVVGNVCDMSTLESEIRMADIVMHLSCESHVDRSLLDPHVFFSTNVTGTFNVLKACHLAGVARCLIVSTDEVFGPSTPAAPAGPYAPLNPSSPYSASKATQDLLCGAFATTWKYQTMLVHPTNVIGPWQYPEKILPLFVVCALQDPPIQLPLYREGEQIRDRMHVSDLAAALIEIGVEHGVPGESYCIQAGNHCTNLNVAEKVCEVLDRPKSLIVSIDDRPGHDANYYLDDSSTRALGWAPRLACDVALDETIRWYASPVGRAYWEPIWGSPMYQQWFHRNYTERLKSARPLF